MTQYTIGERCSGKTTKLIERSAKEGLYILTGTKNQADYIFRKAKEMNLAIPYPLCINEFLLNGYFVDSSIIRDGMLIDELDVVLSGLFNGIPIREVTISDRGNVQRIDTMKSNYRHERKFIKGELPPKTGRYMVRYNGREGYDAFYADDNMWWSAGVFDKPEEVEWDPNSYMPL